jgi:N-dimethylarginine dimethylaminohydrolase
LQGLIEGLEAFHAEFNNNVPTAVGGVQRLNFWDASQRFHHGCRVFAFDCHHGDGANALRFGFWFEPHGKTANHAVGGQSVDAVLHCSARDFEDLLSRFRHPERRGEEQHFKKRFRVLMERGFIFDEVAQLPPNCFQEGAGDCIWDAARGRFWAGYGQRSTRQAAVEVSAFFGRETTALELVSPRFYHLDVCFCPLSGGEIFYYPPAFSAASLAKIHDVVAPEDLIGATDEDAARFNVNAINIDDRLVMANASLDLVARLAERGYRVSQVDLLPFIMSGGGAYCMALRLDGRSAEASALLRAAE